MKLTYYKTQTDLADALILRIDKYWSMEMEESIFIQEIQELIDSNQDLLMKNGKYTSIIQHRLGKKRLKLLEKILKK